MDDDDDDYDDGSSDFGMNYGASFISYKNRVKKGSIFPKKDA